MPLLEECVLSDNGSLYSVSQKHGKRIPASQWLYINEAKSKYLFSAYLPDMRSELMLRVDWSVTCISWSALVQHSTALGFIQSQIGLASHCPALMCASFLNWIWWKTKCMDYFCRSCNQQWCIWVTIEATEISSEELSLQRLAGRVCHCQSQEWA